MNEPLFKLIREIYEQGKKTARDMYGADGWVLHHNTDQWRITGPVDRAQTGLWYCWRGMALSSSVGTLFIYAG